MVVSQEPDICTVSIDYTKEGFPIWSKKIIIEDKYWLAKDVFIAPGVTIGKGTVVDTGSSVYKDLPAGKICIGSPAKVIKERLIDK